MSKKRLTAIIGIRVYSEWKKTAIEEAKKRGMTLSGFIYDCIEKGWEKVVTQERDVKQTKDKSV